MHARAIVFALAVSIPSLAWSQSTPTDRALATITEQDVRRRIGIIADDSMGGRDTPSPGLERTAAWVASEFKRLGLRPGGDDGSYIQRYPITLAEPDADSTFMEFSSTTGTRFKLAFGPDASLMGSAPASLTSLPVVLISGPLDSTGLASTKAEGAVVVWVQPNSISEASPRQMFRAFGQLGATAFVIVASGQGGGGRPLDPRVSLGAPTAGNQGSGGAARFLSMVDGATIAAKAPELGPQLSELQAATAMTVTPLPDWEAKVVGRYLAPRESSLPNVVGIIEGSDPTLSKEYLVLSAHMDHVGSRCGGGTASDQICNGADDDASGTVGIVELAEAFATPGARPKRSLIFLTVSAEERGLWGSRYFAANPPVPITAMAANLNMDMIGRNWADSIVAIGKTHSDLGQTVDRIAATHPELGLTVSDDLWPEENLYRRSDHFNFARRGVPILFFTSGLHEDYHRVSDSPDKIGAEKEARILQLVFRLAKEVGDRPERPQWNPASYKTIVTDRP